MVFFCPDILRLTKNSIEMKISVVNAQIPVSFYLINETNNCFAIAISGVYTIYYFPIGNYNINTFITQWSTTVGSGWVITFSSITNKLNFTYTSNFTLSDTTYSIFTLLGFKIGSIYQSSSYSLSSEFCINFGGLTRLLISSSTFNIHNILCSDDAISNILCAIPINCAQSNIINYTNLTTFKNSFKSRDISAIQISICDDDQNYINFNNVDWTMTLQIDVLNEVIQTLDDLTDVYENAIQEL